MERQAQAIRGLFLNRNSGLKVTTKVAAGGQSAIAEILGEMS